MVVKLAVVVRMLVVVVMVIMVAAAAVVVVVMTMSMTVKVDGSRGGSKGCRDSRSSVGCSSGVWLSSKLVPNCV